jgi:hypothetical protein
MIVDFKKHPLQGETDSSNVPSDSQTGAVPMASEKVNFEQAKPSRKPSAADDAAREQSTIVFPNNDLDVAVQVARHVYERSGLGACPLDELAAQAGTTMSGNFRNKNSAARIFGFIEKGGQSTIKLTDLGARLVSAESEADAKATAFLNVPLYSQIYEKYRGKLLPPTKALEREMVSLGVIPTQAKAARQIMQRSARQAGYFNSGEDRLVRPRTTAAGGTAAETLDQTVADAPAPREEEAPRRNGYGGGGGGQYHPFIQGLLQTLPEPGTLWTVEGRAAWLQAAAQNFTLIYKGEGKIDVQVHAKADKAA